VFAESAITGAEGGGDVRVDVEFADNFAVNANGDDDFGFGFKRAREIAWIGINVVDDDGLSRGSSGAANALVQRDAGMGSHGSLEGAENENVTIAILFQHVKADPIVARKSFVKHSDDGLHERVGGAARNGERVESRDEVRGFGLCGGHRSSRTSLTMSALSNTF
jgi:hypothetical protein